MKNHLKIILFYLTFVNQSFTQNNALHFDGIDDYVELPKDIGNFDFNENFTISIWIKPALEQDDLGSPENDFLGKWDPNVGFPFVMKYLNKTAGKNDEGRIVVGRDDRKGFSTKLVSTIKVNDGKWHNLILIRNGEYLSLYIDAQPAGNAEETTEGSTKNNSPLYLGKRGLGSNFYKGELDELHIWFNNNFEALKNIHYKYLSDDGDMASFSFDEGTPNGQNYSVNTIQDNYQNSKGVLHNFSLNGNESNFVANPTVFIDNTVTTITIESPIGIENSKKATTENEVPVLGLVNSIPPIASVFINNIPANEKSNSKKFNKIIKLKNGDNNVNITAIDKYGKKTEKSFIITKLNTQISSNTALLPKIDPGKRVALVIGNSNYKNAAKLKNPINDAKLMDSELVDLGFKVQVLIDASKAQIRQAILNYKNELLKDSKTTGVFYYAGHGIQDKKQHNFIVPIEASMDSEEVIEDECYDIERLLLNLNEAKNDLNIVILDACRNNPFARSFRGDTGGGLAAKTPPKGVFIAYATEPGNVADDGKGENGLYTEALVKALKEPRLKIEDVSKMTREEVYKNSNEKQLPWDRAFILGNFYFNVK